jgi:hypothetical protein
MTPFAELTFMELLYLNANTFQISPEEFAQASLDLSSFNLPLTAV